MHRHVIIKGDNSAWEEHFLCQLQIVAAMLARMPAIYRQEFYSLSLKQFWDIPQRKAQSVSLNDYKIPLLRWQERLQMTAEYGKRTPSGTVNIEALILKYVNRKTFLIVVPERIQ